MSGSEPTWWEIIEAAERRGRFTMEEQERACHWVTCACGKQDQRIPKLSSGRPEDALLVRLGVRFAFNLSDNEFANARETLWQIETRAAEILAEMEEWQ